MSGASIWGLFYPGMTSNPSSQIHRDFAVQIPNVKLKFQEGFYEHANQGRNVPCWDWPQQRERLHHAFQRKHAAISARKRFQKLTKPPGQCDHARYPN
mmetsp:Transcript_80608/g.133415  ORF Transcript_80608/g.133415 Transcript_80608/m.133415 type:complete len:98 (-) Transcript_80608:1052-1345(-)